VLIAPESEIKKRALEPTKMPQKTEKKRRRVSPQDVHPILLCSRFCHNTTENQLIPKTKQHYDYYYLFLKKRKESKAKERKRTPSSSISPSSVVMKGR
jgi:hypothetical protein